MMPGFLQRKIVMLPAVLVSVSHGQVIYSNDFSSVQEIVSATNGNTNFVGTNPLSPPCIPPKFVLHGLSSKSKFLAIILIEFA